MRALLSAARIKNLGLKHTVVESFALCNRWQPLEHLAAERFASRDTKLQRVLLFACGDAWPLLKHLVYNILLAFLASSCGKSWSEAQARCVSVTFSASPCSVFIGVRFWGLRPVHILEKHCWAKILKLSVVESFALCSTWQEFGAQAPSCFATGDRSVHTESLQIQVIELSNHWMQELNNVGDAP